MSRYWAKIGTDGVVIDIVKADEEFINSGHMGDPSQFVETTKDNEDGFRGQMARVGGTYDADIDQFKSVKPYPSWVWNEEEWHWEAPIPLTEDQNTELYAWSETKQAWVTEDEQ